MVELLQPGDAVGGDAVEPVPLEHEAPQRALQPGGAGPEPECWALSREGGLEGQVSQVKY